MTLIPVAAAVAVVLGAVVGTAARSARVALLGLAVVLLFSPFIADPLPDTLPLTIRLVAGTLAGYLLLVTARRAAGPVGSPLGAAASLAATAAAFAAGLQPFTLGLARLGPDAAMAAGLACLVVALPAVVAARDAFRLGTGLLVGLSGALVLRAALAGSPSPAEEVAIAFAIVTLGGAVAILGAAASGATGALGLDDLATHPGGARRRGSPPVPPR